MKYLILLPLMILSASLGHAQTSRPALKELVVTGAAILPMGERIDQVYILRSEKPTVMTGHCGFSPGIFPSPETARVLQVFLYDEAAQKDVGFYSRGMRAETCLALVKKLNQASAQKPVTVIIDRAAKTVLTVK